MKPAPLLGILIAIATFTATAVRAESLIAAMSSHQIQINSNYTGSQLTVFGLVDEETRW